MTIIEDIEKKCSVCGKTSPQPVLFSTNTQGYPDLDLRPAEMQRSTMNTWISECPHCRYVARNIEDPLEISHEFLKTEEYLTCDGFNFKSKLAERFYRDFLISNAKTNHTSEFLSLHHCSWVCDDSDDELAVEMRKLALSVIDRINVESDEEKDNLLLIKADLLRRTLQFDEIINKYSEVSFDEKIKNVIIQFQLELAEKKDSACYTVEDAVNGEY